MEPTLAQLTTMHDGALPHGGELLDQVPMAVLVCDLAGRVITRNATYDALFADPAPHRLLHLRDLFEERGRARLPETIANAFGSLAQGREGIAELVATCRKVDQSPLPCNVVVRVVASPQQAAAHLVVLLHPLHDSTRQIERLKRSEHRFNTLLGHLPVGILGSDSGMRVDYVNAAVAEVFGTGPELLLGRGWLDFLHPDDVDRAADAIEDALNDRRPAFVPLRIERPDGEERWTHLRVAPVGVGDDLGFVASMDDVTEQRQLGDALTYQARHDLLTGLLNRSMVEERLREYLDRAGTHGARPALLFVDLDDFKDINDSLGHLVGDKVLTAMADRLYACAQPHGSVARFGGDEFVVILPHLTTADTALALANTVVDAVSRPLQIDGYDVHCTASVGVAWLVTDEVVATNASEFLRRADLALYQAKRGGKNQAVLASDELLATERRRLRLTRALRRAIYEDELDVHFQPIVDLTNDRIVGLEALVRWTDPELGRISPDVFVPTAEANGLVGALGRNVLRRALRELADWRRLPGYDRLYVSVNMSMHELDETAVARQLATALGEAELPASALYVELTESALLRRETTAVERLDAIRRLGIRLAIDDFG
ncbi:MAG: putative bifunctional diguanylate cyclase/phosphodiesterase, partial [Acidimicrobiia bacterium]